MNRKLTNQTLQLGGRDFTILEVIGTGASCVVYRAVCPDQTEHLLKEYNPKHIEMYRSESGELCLESEEDRAEFETGLVRFREGHARQRELRLDSDLKNSTSNVQQIYCANGTEYIDMTCFAGQSYEKVQEKSVYDLLRRIKAVAQVIGNYHRAGLLHLDIKPQNIFTLPETCELVMLFDFDSVTSKNDAAVGKARSYTLSWAAPEQINPLKRRSICEATDVFAMGEMIFYQLMGRNSNTEERRSFADYSFDHTLPIFENVNPKVFPMLEDLLHHTICGAAKQRYQSAIELIAKLDEIIKIADPKEPYLKSSAYTVQDFFVGRDVEIREIHEKLSENRILFLSGIGGIGKSELAKHYAQTYRSDYETVIFAPYVSDVSMLIRNDTAIPIYNFTPYPAETPEDYCARKLKKLHELCDERTLIIVDNLDRNNDPDIEKLLELGCKMLITTRRDFTGFGKPQLFIDSLQDPRQIRAIFDQYYASQNEEESHCVDEIIAILEGHTMAVELIAKQINAEWATADEILEKLKETGVAGIGDSAVDSGKDGLTSRNAYAHIKALFDLSIFKKNNNENALYVLANLALVPHTGIDRRSFAKWCKLDQHGGKHVINELTKTGWVRKSKEQRNISLHPVVSDVVKSLLASQPTLVDCLYSSIMDVWSGKNFSTLVASDRIPLINLFAYIAGQTVNVEVQTKVAALFLSSDFWIEYAANHIHNSYDKIKKYYQTAVSIISRLKGESCFDIVEPYGNLGLLLAYSGNLEDAEKCTRHAISIYENIEEQDPAFNGLLLGNLGYILAEAGEYEEAEKQYLKAIELHNSILSPRHHHIALNHNNLGSLYQNIDKFNLAEKHFLIGLDIQCEICGETHIDTALISNNLGCLYSEMGDSDKALLFYQRALDIRKKLLGENNAETADSYHGIGFVHLSRKEYVLAEENLKKALEIRQIIFGPISLKVAISTNCLGGLYGEQAKYAQQEKCYRTALNIATTLTGENSAEAARYNNNLGAHYEETDKLEEAEFYLMRALKIREKLFGAEHSDTANTYYRLGLLYQRKGAVDVARQYIERGYAVYAKVFGDTHPKTIKMKNTLLELWED